MRDARAERGGDDHRQDDSGEGEHQIGDAHDHLIGVAPEETSDTAEERARARAPAHGGDADGEREPRAVEDAAEDVAAERVRAEPVLALGPVSRVLKSCFSGR